MSTGDVDLGDFLMILKDNVLSMGCLDMTHSKNHKYFPVPFLVPQPFVTNMGLLSVPGCTPQ